MSLIPVGNQTHFCFIISECDLKNGPDVFKRCSRSFSGLILMFWKKDLGD